MYTQNSSFDGKDEKKVEVEKSIKGIIGVASLLLCIFFFTLPLAQCTQDSSMAYSGWEIAKDRSEYSSNANIFVFLFLIIPVVLAILAFINSKFSLLFIFSSLGTVSKIIFIIVLYTKYKDMYIPTIFSWIILFFYIGLCGITVYCTVRNNEMYKLIVKRTLNVKGELKMSKSTARILSKIGLSMVAIGFFMPFAEKMNVFGILDNLSSMASWLGIDMGSYKFQIYLIFISSVIGVILLCLLFANKSIRLAFDWCTVLIANGSFLILLIRLSNLANKAMGRFGGRSSDLKDLIGDNLQIGAYFIIIGLITSVIFLIVATSFEHGSTILKKDGSSGENIPIQFSGKAYDVITATKIFYERDTNSYAVKDLDVRDRVYPQYAVKAAQILWYFVKTSSVEGWCKAEYLKEC